jgi:RNA polymerase sigma-70 factor (ECF subfamily)
MAAATRNTDEFIRLFSLYTNNIYSYIHVLAPVHADAEDVFQETSRTLWEKFGEYTPGPDAGFLAWALAIARIEVLRHRQREGRRQSVFSDRLQEVLDQATLAAMDSVDWRIESLTDCYGKLPSDDRRVIDSRYGRETAVELIAIELGRSVHSIYRALRRIHTALFDCIHQAQSREEHRQ